ncbi:MAG: hypothetical protein B7Z81_07655, partial [Acidocella sp. 20-61-6]
MPPSDAIIDPVGPGYAAVPLTEPAAMPANSSSQSGVSWAAVFAGGVSGAAIATILTLLGAGLGLASVSPWRGDGLSPGTFTVLAAIWLIVVQWVSSGVGGYMAGRLRTKWVAVHTDEVFFRDTAHGFLAWSLGTLFVVGILTLGTSSAIDNGTKLAAATTARQTTANRYYVDLLFRQNANPAAQANGGSVLGASAPGGNPPGMTNQEMRQQAGIILRQGMIDGGVSSTDQAYLAQLVADQTGLPPADAQARVSGVLNREHADVAKTKQIADATRKAGS